MVTLKEIAEICNVSAMTVSNVVNGKAKASEETTKRILAVIKETGYQPNYAAKGLRTKRMRTVAVIAEDISQFTSPYMVESITAHCEARDYRVILYNLRLYARWSDTWYDQEQAYHSILDPVLQSIRSAAADGIIYLAGHARNIRLKASALPAPTVMAYAFSDALDIPSVVIDDEASAAELVGYLLETGHRRIGFLGGREDNLHTVQRLKGYQQALYQSGVLFDPALVYYGTWARESGYEGARMLTAQGVDAIFSISDRMAGGVYDYLEDNGMAVGREVSVAGYDNEYISGYFRPALTTTTLPLFAIGETAAKLLLDRLESGGREQKDASSGPQIVKIPCEMVVRESVARREKN